VLLLRFVEVYTAAQLRSACLR